MSEDSIHLILSEIRQLRTEVRQDIQSIKVDMKPSNSELSILVDNIQDDVETLREEMEDQKKFRNYSWGIISFLVIVSSLIGKNIVSILKWMKIL